MADTDFPQRERITLLACFLAGGLGIGSWGANLPALGRWAGLDEGALGLVLLSFAAGAILAMTKAPPVIARIGAERLSVIVAGLFGLGIIGIGWVTQMAAAVILASLAGLVFGALDVAMNSQASYLERRARRPVMSSFHAMFSAGTLIGALTYAALAHRGVGNGSILSLSGSVIVVIAVAAFTRTTVAVAEPANDATTARSRARPGTAALVLGTLAFVIFLAEGAIMDWAAVYLVRVIGTSESIGAAGYAIFAGMMLLGRLLGDRANRALGPSRLFRISVAAVALSMAAFLLSGSVYLAFAALACSGLAMANVIPLIFSAAGMLGARDGGRSLSRVISMGYAGILLGPALIGFLAQAVSLTASLSLVLVGLAAVAFFGRHFKEGILS
ncbi:MFS transporter [Paracoccus denitrificans]|jgi:fucose permease|uniref:MFS transporter n=1 Tax=Paracoccus denitrificans TaxID=266 RepID=UPI0033651DAC